MQNTTYKFIVRLSDLRQDVAYYKNHKESQNEELFETIRFKLDILQTKYPEAYNFLLNLSFHWKDDKEMRINGKVIEQLSGFLLFKKPTLEMKHLSGARWSMIETCTFN